MTDRRFTRFSVAVLVYNVGVVLFGAVVRATGSGAGCGADWPRCQGSFVPEGTETATLNGVSPSNGGCPVNMK